MGEVTAGWQELCVSSDSDEWVAWMECDLVSVCRSVK